MNHRSLALAAILGAATLPGHSKTICGVPNGTEHDYRTASASVLRLVNDNHFNEDVEAGVKGMTGSVGGDLDYTLRKIPNHKRALNTALMLAPRYPNGKIPGALLPYECYFERAIRYFPDDSTGWLMYGRFSYQRGNIAQALEMLKKAQQLSPEDPTINYNLGLVYAKQKQFEQALPYAQKAYALQFPLPGLKQMLVAAGKWVEPPAAEAEPAPEAAAPGTAAPAAAAQAAASTPPGKP